MGKELSRVLAAIRGQPWAILPSYLDAIDALATRAWEAGALDIVAADGHAERLADNRCAVAAMGAPLAGASYSTIRDGAAIVPILGPIFPRANLAASSAGGIPLDAIMRDFRAAQASPDVKRIVLFVDSPGGVVSGLGEAAMAIRESEKPVSAFVSGVAASAAYWLASQASEIVVEPAAAVGSIGAIVTVSRQESPGADGVMQHEVVSSNAPYKRPDPTTDEGRASLQAIVDAIEDVFVNDVARGRGVTAATVRKDFGRGGMLQAKAAVAAGMADKVGTLEAMLGGRSKPGGGQGRYRRASADLELRRRAATVERTN